MRLSITLLFWALAAIHILPALSALSVDRLSSLYGVVPAYKTLMTLLQHRAVLFGLVAAACVYAAHNPESQWPVLIGTIISMGSFILIALSRGQTDGPLAKIIYVDGIGLILAAIIAFLLARI